MIESLECRRMFATYDDLLQLAQNYNSKTKTWEPGDSNFNGTVNFDDLLTLASQYGSGAFTNVTIPFGQSVAATARLDGKKLIIDLNRAGTYRLWSTTSNGLMSVRERSPSGVEEVLISVKQSKVKSVQINDNGASNTITVESSLPAASIYLNGGDDKLITGDRDDRIYGGAGNDTIYAGSGNDSIYGGEGNDSLFGEGGNDKLDGNAHKDRLDGGSGKNELIGGEGTDYFTVRAKDKVRREDRDHVNLVR